MLVLLVKQNRKKMFVSTVCKKLGVKERWNVINPSERRGGLLVFWGETIQVHQIIKLDFCMELEIEGEGFEGKCWLIFIYASTYLCTMKMQWDVLLEKRKS